MSVETAKPPKREGVIYPKFAEKFYKIDFEAGPMPVLCLYPIPAPVGLQDLRIDFSGLEEHSRSIPWKTLESLPRVKLTVPLICQIFNWSETVEWEGIRVADILDFLKVETCPDGYYAFYSRDGSYFETLSRDEARDPRVLLAYGLNGAPLPLDNGGPLRLVVPFLQGYKSVKWIGSVRAFRYDPSGIKRLLGQSPSGQLNETWIKKYQIERPAGLAGDPPFPSAATPPPAATPDAVSKPPMPAVRAEVSAGRAGSDAPGKSSQSILTEILAIVRPSRREETIHALEKAGIDSYTTYVVQGRGQQRGLKFPSKDGEPTAIKFLPKQLFQIVIENRAIGRAIDAILQANRTGKGEYGDGKIFVLNMEESVRVSTGDRGGEAI